MSHLSFEASQSDETASILLFCLCSKSFDTDLSTGETIVSLAIKELPLILFEKLFPVLLELL